MVKISDDTIRAYAVENALKYNGKSNKNSILSCLFNEGLQKLEITNYLPTIEKIVNEVNSMGLDEQSKLYEELKDLVSRRNVRIGLPDLPNAKKGHVVMRMAPFPSGAIHIGNSRPLILNDEYAKIYDGKFLLIVDDTIGSEAKPITPDSYKLIEEDARWLGCNFDKLLYKSDRFLEHHKYAYDLIEKGFIYVCSCSAEQFREYKKKKMECPCRSNDIKENIRLWEKMFDKNESKEGDLVARLKTDMKHPDPAFRDRVMFKISDRVHPRTGTSVRVFPTMEFSWVIDNHYFGITHIIRGIELDIEGKVENYIRKIYGWEDPVVINNGLLIIDGIKLSKSKGLQEVTSGKYIGWNDPRLWSIQSLRSRGFKPEAIREFIVSQGIKKSNTTVPIEVLYKINKKYIERSKRLFFVTKPKEIEIKNCPLINAKLPYYPDGSLGFREYNTNQKFLISEDDYDDIIKEKDINIRLMHLLTCKATFNDNTSSNCLSFKFESTEQVSDIKQKYIHWLPLSKDNVEVEVIMPDGEVIKGLGESEIKKLNNGEIIQFERFGFVKLERKEKDTYKFFFTHK